MKKWIAVLGATASIMTPAVALVSCGKSGEAPEQDKTNDGDQAPVTLTPTTTTKPVDIPVVAPLAKPQDQITQQPPTTPTFTTWDVAEDGIYFKKSTYNGKIFSTVAQAGKGSESTAGDDELIPMPEHQSPIGQENAVEIGDGDTFYVAFDKDDTDGLTFDKFGEEFFFDDTSYMLSSGKGKPETAIDKFNTANGSQWVEMMGGAYILIPFKDGKTPAWVGSQSNHMNKSYDEAMADLKTQVSQDIYDAVEVYYQSHDKGFVPLYQPEGLFTYRQVANNAYAITYHHKGTRITASAMVLKPTNGNKRTNWFNFSVGDEKEWEAYHKLSWATYFAKKN